MTDEELTFEVLLASSVLISAITLYILGGLMTVIVAAAIFDVSLRRVEAQQMRLAKERAENHGNPKGIL